MPHAISLTRRRYRYVFYPAAIVMLAMASWLTTATSTAKAAELATAGGIAAMARPGDSTLALVPPDAFQNACTALRQARGEAAAEAQMEDGPLPYLAPNPVVDWRRAFTEYSRNGPIQPRYCWGNQQAPDDIGVPGR